jgi:hypothetical protein
MQLISTVKCKCSVHNVPLHVNFMFTAEFILDSTKHALVVESWGRALSECNGWTKNITWLTFLRARGDIKGRITEEFD